MSPDRYARDPDPVLATQYEGGSVTGKAIASWCGGEYVEDVSPKDHRDVHEFIKVPNVEGLLIAYVSDFVFKRGNGRFYVLNEKDFNAIYNKQTGATPR